MGFDVSFWKFNKEENSTIRPTATPDIFNCRIKRGSGLVAPRIELNIGLTTTPDWNYCYVPNFSRYYYVTEWYFDNALWSANLQCDVLATYRNEIGSADLYALRSSANWDGRIVDNLYPTKANPTVSITASTNPTDNPWTITDGYFVIGIINQDPEFGALNYYVLTPVQFKVLLDKLLDNTFLGVPDNVTKSILDPLQYIKSCLYIPYNGNVSNMCYVSSSIDVGSWSIPFAQNTIKRLKGDRPTLAVVLGTFTLPKHPQASTRGVFLNSSPYTSYMLSVPPFGLIELDTSALTDATLVQATCVIDFPSGLGILTIMRGYNDYMLNRIEGQIGVPISISQVTRDYLGGITSTLASASTLGVGIATMNPALATSGLVSGIGNAIQAITPRSQTIGSGGSYAQLIRKPELYSEFFEIVNDDIAKNGRPLCQIVNCEDATGYYLIQDGDVGISGTREEASQVRSYLESGFYWY